MNNNLNFKNIKKIFLFFLCALVLMSISSNAQTKKKIIKRKTQSSSKTAAKKKVTTTSVNSKSKSIPVKTTAQKKETTQKPATTSQQVSIPEQKKVEPPNANAYPSHELEKSSTTSSTETKKNKSNFKLNSQLTAAIDIGGSVSWAKGDFINYHKSFADVTEPNTTFKGKIIPAYSVVVGISFRFQPFVKYKTLSKLSIISACSYLKTGFTSVVTSTYKDPTTDYTDELIYKEHYSNKYFTRQLIVRYGKKFFAELGLVKFNQRGANRTIMLEHKQEGSDAYNGGYSEKQKEKFELDESLLVKKKTNLIVGIGFSMFKNRSLKISEIFTGETFISGLNYKNYITQLQLSIPIYNTNIKTK